jgi:hypothetical protein
MSAVAALFRSLDSSFINFKEKVDPIIWQGRDVNVHNLYEVKIPVQAGSIIKYSFTTNGGDIEFSSNHHKTGGDIEVVTEAMRVPSDAEKINGSHSKHSTPYTLYTLYTLHPIHHTPYS